MTALAGDDEEPAIPSFDPDVGAELYTTNGDTNDHMYKSDRNALIHSGGHQAAGTGSGFIFQDVEADVQEEFEKHVQLRSTWRGRRTARRVRTATWATRCRTSSSTTSSVSYGDPQTVQVNARRDLGRDPPEVPGERRQGPEEVPPASGAAASATATRATTGTTACADRSPGRTRATAWRWVYLRTKGNRKSGSFTYEVRSDSNADVLVLAVEDYSGKRRFAARVHHGAELPPVLHDALAEPPHDVYDYDAMGRKAPDPLGVLSHYDAVIWYTGNDNVTRSRPPGRGGPGGASHDHRGA